MARSTRSTTIPTGRSQIPVSAQTNSKRVLKKGDLLSPSLGGSGTKIYNGFIENDYNASLEGQEGLFKYEKMRKSDAQVQATLLVIELPIRATEWYIDPAKDENNVVTPEAQEQADFVTEALFHKLKRPWDDQLREELTMLPFGHSVFEKVYTADDEHVWLESLDSRAQNTIVKWVQEDNTPGITQTLTNPVVGGPNDGKRIVSIPAEKLVIFTFRQEGDNIEGTSILRSAYKHFYIKDNLYKFDAVRHERQGLGIPVMTLPEQAGPEDGDRAQAILEQFRANEKTGLVIPFGFKFEFADTKSGSNSDMWKSIDHHNAMIAKNVLAMFMEIVTGEGGSRALSEDQSDFFLLACEAIAKYIDNIHNTYVIPELINFNYEGVTQYPKLCHKRLGTIDFEKIVNAITSAVDSSIIEPDLDLEVYLRDVLGLPPKMSAEDRADIEQEENDAFASIDQVDGSGTVVDTQLDDQGNPVDANGELLQATEPLFFVADEVLYAFYEGQWIEEEGEEFRVVSESTKKKISESLKRKGRRSSIRTTGRATASRNARLGKKVSELKQKGAAAKGAAKQRISKAATKLKQKSYSDGSTYEHKMPMFADPKYMALSAMVDNKMVLQLQGSIERSDLPSIRARGFQFNDYEDSAWRGLTFAERKVNLSSLEKAIEKSKKDLEKQLGATTAKMSEDLLSQVKKAVDNNDIKAVGQIKAKYTGEVASALTDVQKQMFDTGKQGASEEMGVKSPATAAEVKGVMRVGNNTLADKLANDMENAAILAVTQVANKYGGSITSTGVAEAVGAAQASIQKVIEDNAGLTTLTIGGGVNLGRASIFERFPELIYGFQYSAILDDKTTDTCLSLDGRVVPAGSPDFYTYSPPRHYNCRSIWVEILKDEEFKPEFTDIPSSIPDNATIDTHTPMRAPVVRPGSPAVKVMKQELEERQGKLDDLQTDGGYQNRQDGHQARIDALKNSLGDDAEFAELLKNVLIADGIRFRK